MNTQTKELIKVSNIVELLEKESLGLELTTDEQLEIDLHYESIYESSNGGKSSRANRPSLIANVLIEKARGLGGKNRPFTIKALCGVETTHQADVSTLIKIIESKGDLQGLPTYARVRGAKVNIEGFLNSVEGIKILSTQKNDNETTVVDNIIVKFK